MSIRKIGVFTGNRAEYGLQLPILKAIDKHPELEYRLIVSGAHLDNNFGRTLDEIKNDGLRIHSTVEINLDSDHLYSTAQAIGLGVIEISKALSNIQPDLFLVYADRFEGFAAVVASTQMNIPTGHLEGGDLTEGGALDDSVRHAMTKLSHLHFTTNQQASNRVLAMGEEPWRVHTVGFPAIDLISEHNYASESEVSEALNLDLDSPIVLFTQHSVTTEYSDASSQIQISLDALKFLASEGIQCVLTYPNNDVGGMKIIDALQSLGKKGSQNIQIHQSLGRYLYHGTLALALNASRRVVCMGNSSSGLKETPAFRCPAVNIGTRQDGRLRGANVLDVPYNKKQIIEATKQCLFDDQFRQICFASENPYWLGNAGSKVADILAKVPLDQSLIQKKMTLKGIENNGWFR